MKRTLFGKTEIESEYYKRERENERKKVRTMKGRQKTKHGPPFSVGFREPAKPSRSVR